MDFRNTIIIMTSNSVRPLYRTICGCHKRQAIEQQVVDKTRDEIVELRSRPSSLSLSTAIDEIVMFTRSPKRMFMQIVDIQLGIISRLLEGNGITLEVTSKAKQWIADEGYDPLYGARPVKRTIQKYIVNDLSSRYSQERSTANSDKPSTRQRRLIFGN